MSGVSSALLDESAALASNGRTMQRQVDAHLTALEAWVRGVHARFILFGLDLACKGRRCKEEAGS